MKDWIVNHKGQLVAAVVALILLVAAYGTGRYLQPAKVVEKEHVVTQIQYQDRVVTKTEVQRVVVGVRQKDRHRETTTVRTPDGTVTTKTVEEDKTASTEHTEQHGGSEQARVSQGSARQVEDKTKTVTAAKPNWRLGPMVGVNLYAAATGSPASISSKLGPVVFGIHAERRIAGPLSIGVWGLTSTDFGASASLEW